LRGWPSGGPWTRSRGSRAGAAAGGSGGGRLAILAGLAAVLLVVALVGPGGAGDQDINSRHNRQEITKQMPVSFSPEANRRAKAPKFNIDATTIYENGIPPVGQMDAIGVMVDGRMCGVTSGSATVTCTDTSDLAVGMVIGGAGVSDGQAFTTQNTGETFTRNTHGIPNGTPVYLTALGTTTGFDLDRIYYVISTAANTLQLAATPGGSAIVVDADGTATLVAMRFVTAITEDTSLTISAPASATDPDAYMSFYKPAAIF
jgi:hypothetical protein